MAPATDLQDPLHEEPSLPVRANARAAAGISFDVAQSGSASAMQQRAHSRLGISLTIRVSVALGIIAILALVANHDNMPMLDANSKFMASTLAVPRQPDLMAQMTGHRELPTGQLGFDRLRQSAGLVQNGNLPAVQLKAAAHFPQAAIEQSVMSTQNNQLARFPTRTAFAGIAPAHAAGAATAGFARRSASTILMSGATQQVATLLTISGLGKLLQKRFPGEESNVIQKLLLVFLVPATLLKGLSGQTVQVSQLGFIGAGIAMIVARMGCGWFAAKTMFGGSTLPESAELSRTAFFQLSTTSSVLSVLPFASEFLGPACVGWCGLVDLPMKLYILIVMPFLLKAIGDTEDYTSSDGGFIYTMKKLVKDPITLSMILGLSAGAATGGRGVAAMGFLGKAITSLAGAQTAILFLLIGLKLKFDSDMPLYSLVCLLASQGGLLMIASLLCVTCPITAAMQQFLLFFAQGAPSVIGLGVIVAAVNSGIKGYSVDFAFDMVGLAFPISAMLQCLAGLLGASYAPISGFVGAGLIGVAGLLRVIFRRKFQRNPEDMFVIEETKIKLAVEEGAPR